MAALDATINGNGLGLGSSEIYQAVEALPEVLDSLVVGLEYLEHESFMPIFVVTAPEAACDEGLKLSINTAIRTTVSPRFVPSAIIAIAETPQTLSGKKLEIPVKKLLLWGDPDQVINRDSMANPERFEAFNTYAKHRISVG